MEEWSQACGPLEPYGGAGLVDGGDPRPGAPHDGTVAEGPREGTTEGGGERAYLGLDPVGDPDPDGGHAYAHGRPCTPTRTTECCGDGVCDGPESHANCPGECAPGAVAWSTPPPCADVVSDATENCKCADGVDNDGDGRSDCDDPDCADDTAACPLEAAVAARAGRGGDPDGGDPDEDPV